MALRPDKPGDIAAKAKRKRIAQTGADLLADELERERDEARAEVERLKAAQTWQPIATAPRGERILLLRHPDQINRVVLWRLEQGDLAVDKLVGWMPLPEPTP